MLVSCGPFRKNSFRAGAKNPREAGVLEQLAQIARRRRRQEGEAGGGRKRRVAQEGAAHPGPQGPARVGGDDRQGIRVGLQPGGGLNDVRLGREPVVEDRGHHPGVGIEPKGRQDAPAGRAGQVDPLGKRHFGETAEEVAVGRASHFGMDPHIRRKVRQVPPEQGRDEGQGLAARRPAGAPRGAGRTT